LFVSASELTRLAHVALEADRPTKALEHLTHAEILEADIRYLLSEIECEEAGEILARIEIQLAASSREKWLGSVKAVLTNGMVQKVGLGIGAGLTAGALVATL